MVVGIGFLSMLIGATDDRFLGTREPGAEEADVLAELRSINERIGRLEANLHDPST